MPEILPIIPFSISQNNYPYSYVFYFLYLIFLLFPYSQELIHHFQVNLHHLIYFDNLAGQLCQHIIFGSGY